MPNDDVIITGLTETQRMIIEFPGELNRAGTERALMAGSAVLQQRLLENAPRGDRAAGKRFEFPPLSQSIVTDVRVDQQHGTGSAETGFGESGPVALWNEYGHEIVTIKGKDTGVATKPNPFMRRTTDESAEAVIDAFAASLLDTLNEQYGQ